MAEPLDAEALFSSVGLGAILDAQPTLHKYQLKEAADLPAAIKSRVLKFIASDSFKPAVEVRDFDYRKTLGILASVPRDGAALQLSQPQADALMASIPDPELAQDMAIQANRILTWADPILPRERRAVVAGGERLDDPGAGATADFRRQWQVAVHPMTVMDDLEDGSLADDQVAALSLLYPAIYGEIRQAVTEAMASMTARKDGWEPSPSKAGVLATLMQTQTIDPELTAAVQAIYAQETGPAPSPQPRRKSQGGGTDLTGSELTPGERAAGT
jgi:hypothetical protein